MKVNNPNLWQDFFSDKESHTHKYDYGHGVIVSGKTMTGATILASKAALRCGLGLLSISAPKDIQSIYKTSIYEAIVHDSDKLRSLLNDEKITCYLIGQGAEGDKDTREKVSTILNKAKGRKIRCILDAGALSSFEDEPENLFESLYEGCVLTPHKGEFDKLFNSTGNRQEDIEAAVKKAGCTIVLKGSETLIASPEKETIINRVSSPWLATGGTGDVLSGILLGLSGFLGYKIPSDLLAASAVWLHGKCGLEAGVGMVSSDLPEHLPKFIAGILKKEF
ncbi:MAG: NAD(P)H-hydrate dehydratase [Alphaproteobacteria bacterium]|nr:NAD(P)H-hydrate dehydratase [Alphaproteobacteria bacterium]